jgi:hypothetical protein
LYNALISIDKENRHDSDNFYAGQRTHIAPNPQWEAAVKNSLNKLAFNGKTQGFLDLSNNNGFGLPAIDKKYIVEGEDVFRREARPH